MSTDRETTHAVRSWLEAGVTRLPDRVLDAVLDQVPATPQRRPLWRARRFCNVNNPLRIAIAAAAVLAVALVGYQLMPANRAPIGGQPSATPTTAPTAGATTIPALPPQSGGVAPGTYLLDTEPALIIDLPSAWPTCCNGVVTRSDFAGLLYADVTGFLVPADSCQWKAGEQSQPKNAREFAAAYAAQVPRNASVPRDVTVAGLPGVHVRLAVPDDQEMDATGFVGCDEGEFVTDLDAKGERSRYHQGPGQVDDIYLIDIEGRTFGFYVVTGPDTSASDRADLGAMLDSLRLADGGSS